MRQRYAMKEMKPAGDLSRMVFREYACAVRTRVGNISNWSRVMIAVRRSFGVALVAVAALCAAGDGVVRAQDPPPIARFVPPAPDARHAFVFDSAHILSAATVAALQDSALALQAGAGVDIVWVTLPTLGSRPIEDATVYIGRTWKVGSAGKPGDPLRNRGLLMLYVPDKTTTAGANFRTEVAMGLQGTITDSRSTAIAAAMRDPLRAKHYDAAYAAGWKTAAALARADYESRAPVTMARDAAALARQAAIAAAAPANAGTDLRPLWGVAIGLVFLLLFVALVRRSRRAGGPVMFVRGAVDAGSSPSNWSSGDSASSSDSGTSGTSGGDMGGGGGFDGGGSSDSI
jgi:uncharacterized protein